MMRRSNSSARRCHVLLRLNPQAPTLVFSVMTAVVWLATAGQLNGSDQSVVSDPYLVFVSQAEAYLRCGPAGEYYRTDPLRHGQELEVYVETADGWLGVRPTEDSFCWVPADAVKLHSPSSQRQGDDQARPGEIVENKTVAWIGTNLGRARRYRWQVQLSEGEPVTILGSSQREGPDGPQTWYRIVPPSGEFRWLHRDQVVNTAEELVASLQDHSSPTLAAANDPIEFLPAGQTSLNQDRFTRPSTKPTDDRDRDNGNHNASPYGPSLLADVNLNERDRRRSARRDLQPPWDDAAGEPLPQDPGGTTGETQAELQTSQPTDDASAIAHTGHPRSFSERVASGLSALMRGRDQRHANLEPVTSSSRRVPELVPIASADAAGNPEDLAHSEAIPIDSSQGPTPAPSPAQPARSAVAAKSNVPESQPTSSTDLQLSTMSIASRPRLVTPGNPELAHETSKVNTEVVGSGVPVSPNPNQVAIVSPPRGALPAQILQTSGIELSTSIDNGIVRPKMRTISAAQLEQVRREVTAAGSGELGLLLSKLMSRGASSPEISLVADAAEQQGDVTVARRARQYQLLAKRRDGDCLVRTEQRSVAIPAPTIAATEPVLTASATGPVDPAVARAVTAVGDQASNMAVAELSIPVPPMPALEGLLVEVYSADPSRPPYAITDSVGATIAYVSPGARVDLKSQLGRHVRLEGKTEILPKLGTPHITATKASIQR